MASDSAVARKSISAANTDIVIYGPVPAGKVITFTLNIFNRRKDAAVDCDVFVGTGVTDDDAFDGGQINPRDALERTSVVATAGEKVTVRAAQTGLTAQIRGFSEEEV